MIGLSRRRLGDGYRAEVIDVGEGRPGQDAVAKCFEEAVPVILGKAPLDADALRPGTCDAVRREVGSGDLLKSINAVGIPREGMDPGIAVECRGQRQQELDVAPAAPWSPDRDRRLAAGQENARWGERLAPPCRLQRNAGQDLSDVPGLTLDGIAEDMRGKAALGRHLGHSLESNLGLSNHPNIGLREALVPGLDRLATAAGERGQNQSPQAGP